MTKHSDSNEPSIPAVVAQTWAAVADKTLTVAADSPDMRATGLSLARTARTVAETIEVCLKPLAVVSYAYAKGRTYFEEKFQANLEERTKRIPSDAVQDPSPAVAAQALQNLAFAHEEPSLEDMYLNLLATSMDGRLSKDAAHPAFVEVVRQLTPYEARLLKDLFLASDKLAVAQLRRKSHAGGYSTIVRYMFGLSDGAKHVEIAGLGVMIDNWVRLGLIKVDFSVAFTHPDAYAWTETRPELERARGDCDLSRESIDVQKGTYEVTEFGQRFASAVGVRAVAAG